MAGVVVKESGLLQGTENRKTRVCAIPQEPLPVARFLQLPK